MTLDNLILNAPHHSTRSEVAAVVANWHDDTHAGAFSMCQEQPCEAVRDADHHDD